MAQANVDLGLLKNINITDGVYAQESAGFFLIALEAPICHHGGVALFYKYLSCFSVEAHQHHGPPVTIFQMVTGG